MTKVVILGGGFGGVGAALDLDKKLGRRKDVKITLIDRSSGQTFTPSLYEVASIFDVDHQHPFHTKMRGAVCIPYGEIFSETAVEIVEAEIAHINLEGRHVATTGGNIFSFDYLVIALGSVVSTYGIPGVQDYAYKFKTIEDGLILADKIEELYSGRGRGEKSLPVKIILGGAGFTGVELAAELSNCVVHMVRRYKIVPQNCSSITLIEAGPAMLPAISEAERGMIKNRLTQLGVNILENAPIAEVGPDFARLKDGRKIEGDLIIWSAGVGASELVKQISGLELDNRDRIMVDEHLRAKNHADIFAIGDAMIFVDPKNQKPVPQLAYAAIEQGRVAAGNISRLIKTGNDRQLARLAAYKPFYSVWIAPVGGKYAIAHVGNWTFSGYLGYLVRQIVDFRYFLTTLPILKAIKLFLTDVRVFAKND